MLKIFETQDGSSSVLSEQFGVSYHSKYGAVQESRHVFIEAGLFYKAIAQKSLKILEIGLGTGLNVFLTYLEAERLGLAIDFTTVEKYPLSAEVAGQLNYPSLLQPEGGAAVFQQIHALPWGEKLPISPFFSLEKLQQPFEELSLPPQFDLVYFDAFSPDVQPGLWDLAFTQTMFNALKPGGALVTYCAKGAYKRALKAAGFHVEALKGPPGKREMTRAIKA
jgi:tRNA U34 5-methylaminomethyl-2-thiouridine-forming methyltransferase MnmC